MLLREGGEGEQLGTGFVEQRRRVGETLLELVDDPAVLLVDGGGVGYLSPGGRIASTVGLTPEQLGREHVTLAPIMANPVTGTLTKLADMAAAGAVRVPIMRTYGLEDVPQGLADFAAGTRGKLAVRIHD